ncbi:MAG: transposase [Muribaculaceae bacterium]|nr:transposase [Muribaculaceae bacterium]
MLHISPPRYGHGLGNFIFSGNFLRKNENINIQWSGNLPHWNQDNVIQYVTFRLSDSLPQSKLKDFILLKNEWLKNHQKPWSEDECEEYEELFDSVDQWLDQGYGECHLKYKEAIDIVEMSLRKYDGKRYDLYDYIIMPNHVHMLILPRIGYELKEILKSIKGYSGNAINKLLGRHGKFWMKESFDRLIRSISDYENKVEYIKHNGDYIKIK